MPEWSPRENSVGRPRLPFPSFPWPVVVREGLRDWGLLPDAGVKTSGLLSLARGTFLGVSFYMVDFTFLQLFLTLCLSLSPPFPTAV